MRNSKNSIVLLLGIFMLGLVSASCSVVSVSECGVGNTIVMRFSSITNTNTHGELLGQGNYNYALCCQGGSGDTSCNGSNKIIGLEFQTNSHSEAPELNNFVYDVCYEDFSCASRTNTCNAGELGILSLSDTTNAHLEMFSSYDTKICCTSNLFDIDGDGILNINDNDIDGDGILNGDDLDVNGDGNIDQFGEIVGNPNGDVDGDGILNINDNDIDGDGILNGDDPDADGNGNMDLLYQNINANGDIDGDGILNINDNDIDGDGILNGDDPDIDGDGVVDQFENVIGLNPNGDIDGDGILNINDNDIDGDGILNGDDPDIDGDGVVDQFEEAFCGNGILDSNEVCDDGNLINGDGCSSVCQTEGSSSSSSSSGGGSSSGRNIRDITFGVMEFGKPFEIVKTQLISLSDEIINLDEEGSRGITSVFFWSLGGLILLLIIVLAVTLIRR